MWHVPSQLYDQRHQSARERGYSSSGEAKSYPLLIEPSVRRSSSTCYEAPVFGGSPLLDLERQTSGQGKAQCAWCKWLSFFMIYQSEWRAYLRTWLIESLHRGGGGQLDAGEAWVQFDLVVYSFVVSRASFSLISSPPLYWKVSIPTAVLSTNASRAGLTNLTLKGAFP